MMKQQKLIERRVTLRDLTEVIRSRINNKRMMKAKDINQTNFEFEKARIGFAEAYIRCEVMR